MLFMYSIEERGGESNYSRPDFSLFLLLSVFSYSIASIATAAAAAAAAHLHHLEDLLPVAVPLLLPSVD